MRTILLLWAGLLLSVLQLSAQSSTQSVVNATGTSYKGTDYQVDWSVGELALVDQMKAGNGQLIITNGFLQPQTLLALDRNRHFNADEVRVLPNPTYDIVEINLLTAQQGTVSMEIYDANGKVLVRRNVQSLGAGHLERISLKPHAAGTYFLRITLAPVYGFNWKTGSYKIIKL
jgi:hypothetical protein